MISVRGIGTKEYWEVFGDPLRRPRVRCPDGRCGEQAADPHGHYERYVQGELRPIYRVCCSRCGVTHGILPDDMCAYNDLTFQQLEQVLDAKGPAAAARAAVQEGESAIRRARRLRQAAERGVARALAALLPAGAGAWLERARRTLGPAPGALSRLRDWLQSRFALFFGGPTGLYRHGRPGFRVRVSTTDLGSVRRD